MLKIKINEKFFSFDKKSLTNTLFRHKNVPTYFLNITNHKIPVFHVISTPMAAIICCSLEVTSAVTHLPFT